MAEFTREVLADHLKSAANDAYTMQGLGYHRLSLILESLSTAIAVEDDAIIDKWTFAARDELVRVISEKGGSNDGR